MKMTVSQLRKIIREVLESRAEEGITATEKLDGDRNRGYYTLDVSHSKEFTLGDGEKMTVPNYETSQLRARIPDGVMELVNIYVAPSAQRKGLARDMVRTALEKAREMGLTVKTSGVYSDQGKALVQSFVDKGLAEPEGGRHTMKI